MSLVYVVAWCALAFASFAANAQLLGLVLVDGHSPRGVHVVSVDSASPAAQAQLQPADVIVAVQGIAVADVDAFRREAQRVHAGETLTLRVVRQGWEKDVQLRSPPTRMSFGLDIIDAPNGGGASIGSVDPVGPAANAGLATGDRITHLNGRAISDASAMRSQIEAAGAKGAPVTLWIERGGWGKEISLSPALLAAGPAARMVSAPAASAARSASATSTLEGEMEAANRQYDAGHWRDAEDAYRKLLSTTGDDAKVWARLCHALVMQARFPEAIETCQRAAALSGEASNYHNIGCSHAALGRNREAIDAYRKAIEHAPDWAPPYAGIAAAYAAQREWANAEEFYRLTVARDAGNQGAWQALGDAASEQGKSAEAIIAYRKALDLGPGSSTLLRSLGWHLYHERRYSEAEAVLLDANRSSPTDATALVSLGSVEEKLGKVAEARQAWQRASELDPAGPTGAIARQNLGALNATLASPITAPVQPPLAAVQPMAPPLPQAAASSPAPSVADARAVPLSPGGAATKASIAIGDFQVKAASAGQYVGDGLREMLLTALHNSGRFVVVERMDIKGLAAEQALSRSRLARPGEAIPEGQMEVADILVYGAVTEFEPEARGGGLSLGMPNVPINLGMQAKSAHMAIDVRLVDVASGRVLATGRVVATARSTQATIGANISTRGVTMPATLGGFHNTPMEQAIRDCIERATAYVIGNTPQSYFHHG